MAVQPMLRLLPPGENSPSKPTVYGSPARSHEKKEVYKVERVPAIDRLMAQRAEEEEEAAQKEAAEGEEGEEGEELHAATVQTYKKSQFWSKEVEEKLGLGGADPYGLLELEDKRWRASADEIRKAYRRLVLTMHPDKKAAAGAEESPKKKSAAQVTEEESEKGEEGGEGEGGEEEEEADTEFKLLSASWELLGNAEARRAYDSIDNFNDFLPTAFRERKSVPRHFYNVFGAPFARQSKFSQQTPVPQLGDENSSQDEVNKFYRFWTSFSSWRDFSLLCEHDLKEAEDREERRWMQRQNKNYAGRIKKEEMSRIAAFVQLAYDNDPRVKAFKEAKDAAKAKAKEDKERALREAKEAEQAAVREKENAAAAAAAASAAENASAAEEKAASKREKERQRSALKKARKEFKVLSEKEAYAARAADFDVIAAVLPVEALTTLTATLLEADTEAGVAALADALKTAMV
uniref:J domain-containing protein n=1 Tax=Haptolina brevifila TaxID=156173 RepID=A0A7S2MPI0_9EUKA|mmetsp:Transcript_5611/g.11739  ORF Transcript_5611/g.11739 Transcript_5611/m.11739 type:complete len:463 (+) Transcript_5611:74-1462(+)